MKKILFISVIVGVLAGCAGSEITVSKCKSYDNGLCINTQTRVVKECKNPVKINKITYCDE